MQSATTPAAQVTPPANRSFPATGMRVLCGAALALVAGIATSMWLESARFERLPGYLQARLRTVAAGREGRVAKILVAPGTVVSPGQALVVLEDPGIEQRAQLRRQEIESLEIELSRTQAALEVELDLQRRDILDRIFETKWRQAQLMRQQLLAPAEIPFSGQLATWTGTLPPVVPQTERSSLIFSNEPVIQPVSARAPAQPADGAHKATIAEFELCTEHIRSLEKMSRDLPEKIARSMGVNLAQARLEHARRALATLEAEQKELTLAAETAGMVGVFQKQVGDRVAANEAIVQLLDEELPYLMVQVPSPRVSDFAPGTVVELRFPGGRKGKGRIEEIPPQTSVMPDEAGEGKETTITAHIDPVGALWPTLPFGSVVEVRRKR